MYQGILDELVKESEVSTTLEDIIGGVDPFGFATSNYGVAAEKEKLSEAEHTQKQLLAGLGGLIGGATVVPSAIFGLISGIKGLATTPGGIKEKLLGGATGFISGAKKPIMGPIKALQARKALGEAVESGKLTPEHVKSIRALEELVPISEVSAIAPKVEGVIAPGQKAILGEIADITEKLPGMGLFSRIKATSRLNKLQKELNLTPEQQAQLKEVKQLPELIEKVTGGESVSLTPGLKKQLEVAYQQSGSPIAEALSAMGLGGTVGGLGAYIQYGKGRKTRQEFERELADERYY
jgi:hypothetical protein